MNLNFLKRKDKKFTGNVFFGPACSEIFINDCCTALNTEPKGVVFSNFSDGESWLQLTDNVREQEVFIVQPTPQHDRNLFILWQMINAAKLASAEKIIVILPYCGYLRQDRKDKPRVALTAKMVLQFIEKAGANRIVIMDPHFSQIQGYTDDAPCEILYGSKIFQDSPYNLVHEHTMVIACDGGAQKIALSYKAKNESLLFGQAVKSRSEHNRIEKIILALEKEDISGESILLVDEMIDTAGTLTKIVEKLESKKPKVINAAITHGILSGRAVELINNSSLDKVYITDTVNVYEKGLGKKFVIIPSGYFFAEAIRRIHLKKSLSSLFN